MKKLLLLVPLLFVLYLPQPLYAETSSPSALPTMPSQAVDYTLPYPGLLPDNPLYVLKVFRDRLVGFFISSPLKKSEFDLLQADKRLAAGYYLVKEPGHKTSLTVETISKAENYMNDAVGALSEAKMEGLPINDTRGTLLTALAKHETVVSQVMQLLPSAKGQLAGELTRVKNLEKSVASMSK